MLFIIIFVLALFKFQVTLNSFTRFPSYTNFIFGTISYCSSSSCCCSLASSSASSSTMSFNLCRPYSILSIILLYNKEGVSRTLCSFPQVHLVLLPQVLIGCCITYYCISQKCTDLLLYNFEKFFTNFLGQGND